MFLHTLQQIVRIDKLSLLGQILNQKLPMKKSFDREFVKIISLKLNRQILNFINGVTSKKETRTKNEQKFILFFIVLEANCSFICKKNFVLKF